jgi:REP element-mobilizing transposase RayT
MKPDVKVSETKRNLPHRQVDDCILFVTWRMAFTLPSDLVQDLTNRKTEYEAKTANLSSEYEKRLHYDFRKQQFDYFDDYIGNDNKLPQTLNNKEIAAIVIELIKSYDKVRYELISYCIMPNHVHLIIKPLAQEDGVFWSLSDIMLSLKGNSANKINKLLNRKGKFWQTESYDHVIRNDKELINSIAYLLNNPIKANLCKTQTEWQYSFIKSDYGTMV